MESEARYLRWFGVLWIAALGLLFLWPGRVPVARTQEGRVLETARQMLESPNYKGWLVPMLNGHLRLQKPPLAYWLAALSYKAFGVSEAVGRFPAILAGWGTLGVTYAIGAWLFNRRAGFIAAAALAGSYLFYRYTRLAETDTLAAFFVTGSVLFFWKAARSERGILLFHMGAVMAGLAAMSKGPPAGFPFLFIILLAAALRDWRVLRRLLSSGCVLTFLAIAGAWYFYLYRHGLLKQVGQEVDDLASGRDHGHWFFGYFLELLTSTAPWSGLFVAGVVFAVGAWKRDDRMKGLLCWFMAIFVPLCLVGNKQVHYLFPLMPPAMLLVAALFDHVMERPGDRDARPVVLIWWITIAGWVVAAVALPVVSIYLQRRVPASDYIISAVMILAAAASRNVYRRRGFAAGVMTSVISCAVWMALVLSVWMPPLVSGDFRVAAGRLHETFGNTKYVFFGQPAKLPLCFEMRQAMEGVTSETELRHMLSINPEMIVLTMTRKKEPQTKIPAGFVHLLTVAGTEQSFDAYRLNE